VATGSRPAIPTIPDISEIPYLTTNSLFEIESLPARLAIIGCGPTGVEMAQAFARLGSDVTAITRDDQLLPGSDGWAASMLREVLEGEGVKFHFSRTIKRVARVVGGVEITLDGNGAADTLIADAVLLATGRRPNIEDLGLDDAGVRFDCFGVAVDKWCRTNVPHIFASGDVTHAPKFTHVAENMSRAAALNAMTRLPLQKYEQRLVPRVTFTDPEVAIIGESAGNLERSGADYTTIDVPFDKVDRARIEGRAFGNIRVYHRRGTILGATVVGPEAGEMIDYFALAMRSGQGLNDISDTLLSYPTMLLGAKRAADQFLLRLPKRWMVQGFRIAHGYRGAVPDYIGTDRVI
jgi:pyruvate/2-oxoglutarate dehydrogenase complex dihydrolipoamide dehydrogenase (E3) component